MPSPLAKRLLLALSEMENPPDKPALATAANVKTPSVHGWFNGQTRRLGKALVPIARLLRVNPEWLNDGRLPMRPGIGPEGSMRVAEQHHAYGATFEIIFIDAPGSCGNGRGDMGTPPAVFKMDGEWLEDRKLLADDLFAVRADGDGNADYITHGDVVIFDSTKKTPDTGKIYLVQHPDGLRIRRLRRDIGNGWVLEYLSYDKTRFPDERVSADQLGLLKIEGQFVFRQGG